MTPEELAAIRDELRAEKCSLVRVPQLCDALEVAWAERAAALDAWHGMGDAWADLQAWADHESDRADRAEEASSNERQKVVNLTGELAVVNDHLADVIERAERAEKRCDELRPWAARWVREGQVAVEALAHVRALCDTDDCYANWSWGDLARAMTDIRAATEGP